MNVDIGIRLMLSQKHQVAFDSNSDSINQKYYFKKLISANIHDFDRALLFVHLYIF